MEPPATTRSSMHVALHLPLAALLLLVVIILGTLSGQSVAEQVLIPGDSLATGQCLGVGCHILKMQSDCNLVLYDGGTAVWASGSQGKGSNCRAIMQFDGNFVIYSDGDKAVWASNTAKAKGYNALILQRDRNLVIYGTAMWASGTNDPRVKASIPKDALLMTSGVLLGGGHGNASTPGAVVAGAGAGEGRHN